MGMPIFLSPSPVVVISRGFYVLQDIKRLRKHISKTLSDAKSK